MSVKIICCFCKWIKFVILFFTEKEEQYEYLTLVEKRKQDEYEARIDELEQEQTKAQVNDIFFVFIGIFQKKKSVTPLLMISTEISRGVNFLEIPGGHQKLLKLQLQGINFNFKYLITSTNNFFPRKIVDWVINVSNFYDSNFCIQL